MEAESIQQILDQKQNIFFPLSNVYKHAYHLHNSLLISGFLVGRLVIMCRINHHCLPDIYNALEERCSILSVKNSTITSTFIQFSGEDAKRNFIINYSKYF